MGETALGISILAGAGVPSSLNLAATHIKHAAGELNIHNPASSTRPSDVPIYENAGRVCSIDFEIRLDYRLVGALPESTPDGRDLSLSAAYNGIRTLMNNLPAACRIPLTLIVERAFCRDGKWHVTSAQIVQGKGRPTISYFTDVQITVQPSAIHNDSGIPTLLLTFDVLDTSWGARPETTSHIWLEASGGARVAGPLADQLGECPSELIAYADIVPPEEFSPDEGSRAPSTTEAAAAIEPAAHQERSTSSTVQGMPQEVDEAKWAANAYGYLLSVYEDTQKWHRHFTGVAIPKLQGVFPDSLAARAVRRELAEHSHTLVERWDTFYRHDLPDATKHMHVSSDHKVLSWTGAVLYWDKSWRSLYLYTEAHFRNLRRCVDAVAAQITALGPAKPAPSMERYQALRDATRSAFELLSSETNHGIGLARYLDAARDSQPAPSWMPLPWRTDPPSGDASVESDLLESLAGLEHAVAATVHPTGDPKEGVAALEAGTAPQGVGYAYVTAPFRGLVTYVAKPTWLGDVRVGAHGTLRPAGVARSLGTGAVRMAGTTLDVLHAKLPRAILDGSQPLVDTRRGLVADGCPPELQDEVGTKLYRWTTRTLSFVRPGGQVPPSLPADGGGDIHSGDGRAQDGRVQDGGRRIDKGKERVEG